MKKNDPILTAEHTHEFQELKPNEMNIATKALATWIAKNFENLEEFARLASALPGGYTCKIYPYGEFEFTRFTKNES